jgi:D-arabinitol dehydrogenase (NADP+)
VKAVVYDAPGSFSVRELPTRQPRSGEVLVRVVQSGVCGTDLHLHEGQSIAVYPMTPGHETVGIIEQLGEAVEGLRG